MSSNNVPNDLRQKLDKLEQQSEGTGNIYSPVLLTQFIAGEIIKGRINELLELEAAERDNDLGFVIHDRIKQLQSLAEQNEGAKQ